MKKNVQQEQMRQIASNIIWGFLDWAQHIKGLEPAALYRDGPYRLGLVEEYLHYQEQAIFGEEGQQGG